MGVNLSDRGSAQASSPKDTQDWIKQRNAALQAKAGSSSSSSSLGQEAGDQFLAGARGAQDAFTMGLGDRAYAGARAIGDAFNGSDLTQAYAQRMDIERKRDAYDAAHYGAARMTGQVLGTGAQIAALGPTEGLLAGGTRIAEATPLLTREFAAIGGGGGVAGLGGQAVSDIANHRLSSFGDYAGSTVGGAVGGLASYFGRGSYAGAAGGAATSMAQDVFNGRAPSPDRGRQAALAGGALGTVGGLLGRYWSENLPIKSPNMASKEELGETFSRARTAARGDTTLEAPKSREALDQGRYTYPDQRSFRNGQPSDIIESKFGRTAKLSKRQTEAYQQLPNYRVDHTLPKDIGALFAVPFWSIGSHPDQSGQ